MDYLMQVTKNDRRYSFKIPQDLYEKMKVGWDIEIKNLNGNDYMNSVFHIVRLNKIDPKQNPQYANNSSNLETVIEIKRALPEGIIERYYSKDYYCSSRTGYETQLYNPHDKEKQMECYVKVTFADGGKQYAYKVSDYMYNRISLGLKTKIEVTGGWTYKDAVVTVVSKGLLQDLNLESKDKLKEIITMRVVPQDKENETSVYKRFGDYPFAEKNWGPTPTSPVPIQSTKLNVDELANSWSSELTQEWAKTPVQPIKTEEQKIYVSSAGNNVKIHNEGMRFEPTPDYPKVDWSQPMNEATKKYFKDSGYNVIENLSIRDANLSSCCRLDMSEKTCYNKLNEKKENKIMKMFGNMDFGKYTGRDIALSYKGVAFRNSDGSYVVQENGDLIDVSDFLINMGDMLYIMPVAVNTIKVGDVIKHNGHFVVVDSCNCDSGIHVIDPVCREAKEIIPVKNMFGFNFVSKIVSLLGENTFGAATASEENPFGNMLPMLMMANEGELDMKNIMMMSMMSGGKGLDMSNPMMMMMLMGGDDSKMSDMLPFLMMQNGGFNFGSKPTSENKSAE